MSNLGKRIKYLRESQDLSQKEFAQILGVQNSTLCQYENGTRIPGDDIKVKIADYFNVSMDYLYGRTETQSKLIPSIPPELQQLQWAFYDGDKPLDEKTLEELIKYKKYLDSQK